MSLLSTADCSLDHCENVSRVHSSYKRLVQIDHVERIQHRSSRRPVMYLAGTDVTSKQHSLSTSDCHDHDCNEGPLYSPDRSEEFIIEESLSFKHLVLKPRCQDDHVPYQNFHRAALKLSTGGIASDQHNFSLSNHHNHDCNDGSVSSQDRSEEFIREQPLSSKHLVLKPRCQVDNVQYQNSHTPDLELLSAGVSSERHDFSTRDFPDRCDIGDRKVPAGEELSTAACPVDESGEITREPSSPKYLVFKPEFHFDHPRKIDQNAQDQVLYRSIANIKLGQHDHSTREHPVKCDRNAGIRQVLICSRTNSADVKRLPFTRESLSEPERLEDVVLQPQVRDHHVDGANDEDDSETQSADDVFADYGKACDHPSELEVTDHRSASPGLGSTVEHDSSPYSSDSADFTETDYQASEVLISDRPSKHTREFTRQGVSRVNIYRLMRSISSDRLTSMSSLADRNGSVAVEEKAASDDNLDMEMRDMSVSNVVDSGKVPLEVLGVEVWSEDERAISNVSKCDIKVSDEPTQLRRTSRKRYVYNLRNLPLFWLLFLFTIASLQVNLYIQSVCSVCFSIYLYYVNCKHHK